MDIKLNFREKGEGFPLILLHGNGENWSYFKRQIDFFSGEYRVIAIDSRGHGESPRGIAPFTIRQMADDLYFFMEEHNIAKAHILGFSDGGNIAACFALKYPHKIEKLILNGANLAPCGVKGYFQVPATALFKTACFFSGRKPSQIPLIADASDAGNRPANKKELLSLMINDPYIEPAELSAINVPVLVIAGTHDIIKCRHTKLIADSLPYSKLVFIDGGHSLAMTRASKFNKAVSSFLKGQEDN